MSLNKIGLRLISGPDTKWHSVATGTLHKTWPWVSLEGVQTIWNNMRVTLQIFSLGGSYNMKWRECAAHWCVAWGYVGVCQGANSSEMVLEKGASRELVSSSQNEQEKSLLVKQCWSSSSIYSSLWPDSPNANAGTDITSLCLYSYVRAEACCTASAPSHCLLCLVLLK